MARALVLLALLGLATCAAAAAARPLRLGDDNCTVSPLVILDSSYTFNLDDYIFVDGDFDNFQTCGEESSLEWTVNGLLDYGRYYYEPAATLGPGTYAGQLDVYLSPYFYGNFTLAATYYFNVTVLNNTAPTDAPSSGSGDCVPSPTVLLDSNYVYGSDDYIAIDGDFSYFRSCDLNAWLTWLVTDASGVAIYNTSGWSFFAYPNSFAPGDYNGTLQVFLGDGVTPASETTFGLSIVNGSVPTDAPTDAPSGSGYQCDPSPTVLLQSDYYFDVWSDVSIYGDYYYFQSCDQAVNMQWSVGAENATGYSFWEPADTFALGTYPGTLNVYFGDNETLVASYSFTVTIGNDTQPVTEAPWTDAPWTDAPPAPCQPDYSVFLSSYYWFEQSEDIVINPDLDFFNSCGADYELDWTLNGFKETGSSFFESAGSLTLGEYQGSLDVVVNGSLVNTLDFNVTVYDGNSTVLAARAKIGQQRVLSKLRAAKKVMALKKPRSAAARAVARKQAGNACDASKLAVGLKLQYTVGESRTVVRPNLRKLVGCGTHPALVWRVGRAMSTGRQLALRNDVFASGAYMGVLEVHSGRTVVKHTFLVVVQRTARASATSFKYHPESKMQARLLGSSSKTAASTGDKASTTNSAPSKSTMLIAGAAGASFVALVAVGVAMAMRRRGGKQIDVERQGLVQYA